MITYYDKVAHWVESYRVPLRSLALVRIFFAASALLLGVSNFTWVSSSPPAFFHPPISLALFWDNFPSYTFLQGLSTLVCICYIFLLFGYCTRITSIALSLLLIVGYTFAYSFDKIDHNIMEVIFPAVMAFSGWGKALSIDASKRSESAYRLSGSVTYGPAWPIALMTLFIGFGYFSAGFGKLSWIDLDPTTHGARSWLLRSYFVHGHQDLLAPLFVSLNSLYLWEAMDLAAVTFEVGFLFAVLRARLFRSFVAAAVFFHFTNYLMLNIPFAGMIRIYGIYLPWGSLIGWVGIQRWNEKLSWQPKRWWLFATILVYVPLFWFAQNVIQDAQPLASSSSVSPLEVIALNLPFADYSTFQPALLFAVGFAGVLISGLALLRGRTRNESTPVES